MGTPLGDSLCPFASLTSPRLSVNRRPAARVGSLHRLQPLPATPLASGLSNPQSRTYLSLRSAPPTPSSQQSHPRIPLPPPLRWSSLLQPPSSQRSHPTAHSILNGRAPRTSSPLPVCNPSSSLPLPINEGHTTKLASLNSPELRAGVAAAGREHGPEWCCNGFLHVTTPFPGLSHCAKFTLPGTKMVDRKL